MLIIGAVVCAAVVMSVHAVGFRVEVQGILLENIEALASDGESEGNKVDCYSSFTNKGSGNRTVVDCGSCMDTRCTDCSDQRTCRK